MATLIPPSPPLAAIPPAAALNPTAAEKPKVDYMSLPCPIPYEEIHREALS
ncbi:hypothetical protein OROGR_027848 [Orobanche gracilis]